MPSFLTGLAAAAVLTAVAIFFYSSVYVTPVESASMQGVHVSPRKL